MYRASIVIGLLLVTTITRAQQNALTESMAIELAFARDSVQQLASGYINQARSDVLTANTWPNPEFRYEREELDSLDLVEQKVVISQKFDFSGRRGINRQAADLQLNAARYKSEAWLAQLKQNIRERYYEALLQQKRHQAHKLTHDQIRLLNKVLKKRRDDGDVSAYDYQRVSAELATIKAKAGNTEVEFHAAMLALQALLGEGAESYKELDGALLPLQIAPLEQAVLLLESQPALRKLKAQSEAYALQQRAESRTFPDVTLGLGWRRDEANGQTDDGLIINASIPLPLFDRRKDKQYSYQAQAMITNSEYQLAHDTASAELTGLWQQSLQYRQTAVAFRKDSVQVTHELIRIAEAYYRAGEIGILELLDAYRSALDAELTALDFEHKARSARIKLDYLSGGSTQ